MSKRLLLVGVALLSTLVCRAQTKGVEGEWHGIWTNPAGAVFTAQMTLETGTGCKTCAAMGDGAILGRIVWTLRKRPGDATGAAGATCTELVKGEMKGEGLLVLHGYSMEEAACGRAVDEYRLAVSDNGKVLGGITLNGGSWTGQLIAVRAER